MENRLGKKLQNNSNGYLKPVPLDLFTRAKNSTMAPTYFRRSRKHKKSGICIKDPIHENDADNLYDYVI